MDPLRPQWPVSARVHSAFTTRTGGVSAPPFDSLNVGVHVGDDPAAVAENRRRVREGLHLPSEPAWLRQVHGVQVLDLDAGPVQQALAAGEAPEADACFTRRPGVVCAIQVADCLPVLLAHLDGAVIGAAHAGWRGLAGGVLEATVRAMGEPAALLAWLGPAIGPESFEVGEEVRAAFLDHDPGATAAFVPNARGRWQCDLYRLARQRLTQAGVSAIHGGGDCTYAAPQRFFSYRRDGQCGRMAALVWLAS